VSAAVVGAAVISIISEFLRRTESATGRFGISTLVLAAIFIGVMVLRSEGLLGRWELDQLVVRGWRALRRKRVEEQAPAPATSAGYEEPRQTVPDHNPGERT
jgi:hypothetical protein